MNETNLKCPDEIAVLTHGCVIGLGVPTNIEKKNGSEYVLLKFFLEPEINEVS